MRPAWKLVHLLCEERGYMHLCLGQNCGGLCRKCGESSFFFLFGMKFDFLCLVPSVTMTYNKFADVRTGQATHKVIGFMVDMWISSFH